MVAVAGLLAEALAAVLAAEWPLARVAQLMSLQLLRLAEALPAGDADERALTGVQPLVRSQVVGLGEAFGAVGAHVRLLTRVDQLMSLEVSRLAEALATLRAGVGPLPGVDALVGLQVSQRAEVFPTLRAGKRLLPLHVARLPHRWALGFGRDDRTPTSSLPGRRLRLPVLGRLQLVQRPPSELRVQFAHAVDQQGIGPQLVEFGAELGHVDGLQAVGLQVGGHGVGLWVLALQGAQLCGVVTLQVHMVVRLDVLQSVRHLEQANMQHQSERQEAFKHPVLPSQKPPPRYSAPSF